MKIEKVVISKASQKGLWNYHVFLIDETGKRFNTVIALELGLEDDPAAAHSMSRAVNTAQKRFALTKYDNGPVTFVPDEEYRTLVCVDESL